MTTKLKTEQTEAREQLLKLVHPGDTVYTVLRHRAASGMYRALDLFVIRDNEPLRIRCRWRYFALKSTTTTLHAHCSIAGCNHHPPGLPSSLTKRAAGHRSHGSEARG